MNRREPASGVVLDESLTLTLREVCEICGTDESLVLEMVKEGIASPIDEAATRWRFSGVALTRMRTAHRLRRDLEINLAGAALALDLLEEIERLKGRRDR